MISRFFEALYNKVIVNIVPNGSSIDVYIELLSKSQVISHAQKNFATTTPNEAMVEFVSEFTKESPFYYISILNTSSEQGAVPSCKKEEIAQHIDLTNMEYMCHEKAWSHYTSSTDLLEIQKSYKKIGIDYIFSPYTVLANFFKDKIGSTMAMFILVQDNSMSLAIFDNGNLLYSEYLDMQVDSDTTDELLSQDVGSEELSLGDEDGIDLEDIDVLDNIESLEDIDAFGDIEDLDTLEDIDEFSESKDIEEELFEVDNEPEEMNDEDNSFNEDYQRYSLIQNSLGHYYNGDEYESQFIENVYIADGVGLSSDLKRYLEEEMFLNVYIRKVTMSMELSELVKMELSI